MADLDAVRLILIGLAVYRVAMDLATGDGPCDALSRWRAGVIARLGADHWLTRGVHCPICLSLWLAPLLLVLDRAVPALTAWLVVAGIAALLARITP